MLFIERIGLQLFKLRSNSTSQGLYWMLLTNCSWAPLMKKVFLEVQRLSRLSEELSPRCKMNSWSNSSRSSAIGTLHLVSSQDILNFLDIYFCSANSTAAQEVLLAIFSCKAAQDLLKTKGIKRMAETLLLYSHRHYDRLSRLLQVRCTCSYR